MWKEDEGEDTPELDKILTVSYCTVYKREGIEISRTRISWVVKAKNQICMKQKKYFSMCYAVLSLSVTRTLSLL